MCPTVTHASPKAHARYAIPLILPPLEYAICAALVAALFVHLPIFVQLALQETLSIMDQLVLHAMLINAHFAVQIISALAVQII